ncbi:MAG TPA: hypothetical protein VFV38_31995 [Ktedonobacteraceae bacterium]|nr:hypothetical protein [Ktedonobacteraceae bacterium]
MSFTEDELQAFTTILEQRFVAHRQEMEQVLNQRMNDLQHTMDQRLASVQQEMLVLKSFVEQEKGPGAGLLTSSNEQPARLEHIFSQLADQKVQQVEAMVDRMLAAQLLGIEQLLNQSMSLRALAQYPPQVVHPQLEAIEVQTELPWEDLAAMMGKALDERLAALNDSLQRSLKNLEQYLALRLHALRDEIARSQGQGQPYSSSLNDMTSAQEILGGIEQLEHILESMQVAMTANHALLSNRLYHHQQLPLERAHPPSQSVPLNGVNSLLAQAKERVAQGQGPEIAAWQKESDGLRGQ